MLLTELLNALYNFQIINKKKYRSPGGLFNHSYFIVWEFLIKMAVLMAIDMFFSYRFPPSKYCTKLSEVIYGSRRVGTSEKGDILKDLVY